MLMGPTVLDGRQENLQGVTLSDHREHSQARACSQLQLIHQQTTRYLMGLMAAPSSGLPEFSGVSGREHRDAGPVAPWGQEGPALCGVDPLSPRVGNLQCPWSHNTPSHTKTPRSSYLRIHRCSKTTEQRDKTLSLLSAPPHSPFPCFPSLFLFSLFYLGQAANAQAGREYVWSDRNLLFCRQEPTEGLQLRECSTPCIDIIFGLFFTLCL